MKKIIELPLSEPIYSTYHYQGMTTSVYVENPSIRNFYLNEIMILTCSKKFLSGYTTPEITIERSYAYANPHLERIWLDMRYLKGHSCAIVKNLLDLGYYVLFMGVDDYYLEGKSWYHTRHFRHDGGICGYNSEDKTFCIYAYDEKWIYRKFWVTQKSFEKGRKAEEKKGNPGKLYALKPKPEQVEFDAERAIITIADYLNSNMDKYPMTDERLARGIVVHEYIAKYLDMLYDGSIPYEKMDWRIFRQIWEHKKVMLERIQNIERALDLGDELSQRYSNVVKEADNMRMLYAAHHMRQKNNVLPIIKRKLLSVTETEKEVLGIMVK